MTPTIQLETWDDQELHTLFAEHLPVLALPDEFAEQLAQAVLDEVSRHVTSAEQPIEEPTAQDPSASSLPASTPPQTHHRRPTLPPCP